MNGPIQEGARARLHRAQQAVLSVFLVLVLAKAWVWAPSGVALKLQTVGLFLWQDALIALLAGSVVYGGGWWMARARPPSSGRWVAWLWWGCFSVLVLYTALNVPLTRILSSPLTAPMLRAARGALADSITLYLGWQTLGIMASVVLAGVAAPWITGQLPRRWLGPACLVPVAVLLAGLTMPAATDTRGLHRNAVWTLAHSFLPRVHATTRSAMIPSFPAPQPDPAAPLQPWAGRAAGRNVLLVVLESTGASYLRPWGATLDPMPHLTLLSRQALLFEAAYAVYPESIKGLFSVLCSRYPAFDTTSHDYAAVTTPALPALLARAGYRTALFHSGRFMYLGMRSVINQRGFDLMEDAGDIGGQQESSFGVDDESTAQRVLTWIDTLPRSQPFFVTYLPVAGHHPYAVPVDGPFPDRAEIDRYHNALHYSDRVLAQLWDGMRRRGLDTNTLLIVIGDHGEAFEQHPGNVGHTLFLHEENLRVPWLIAAPGLIREPVRVAQPVSLLDLAPTLLDLLGRDIPREYQGLSLLRGAVRPALFLTDYSVGYAGLRDGDWKFIHDLDTDQMQLYHLGSDPGETLNLAGICPERADRYRTELFGWAQQQKVLVTAPTPPKTLSYHLR